MSWFSALLETPGIKKLFSPPTKEIKNHTTSLVVPNFCHTFPIFNCNFLCHKDDFFEGILFLDSLDAFFGQQSQLEFIGLNLFVFVCVSQSELIPTHKIETRESRRKQKQRNLLSKSLFYYIIILWGNFVTRKVSFLCALLRKILNFVRLASK